MRIEDFIVLGRTVPEDSKKYGKRVCMAGWSPELNQLLRIYSLLISNPLKSRHCASLELERNHGDNRSESFKLKDASDSILSVSSSSVVKTDDIFSLPTSSSIARLNQEKKSLGLVRVIGHPRMKWKTRKEPIYSSQPDLFDEMTQDLRINGFLVGSDYENIPYVEFRDEGGMHCLQLREWGCFEYLRKFNWDGNGLEAGLKMNVQETNREWLALVGNMAHRRNVWLVIQVFSREQKGQETLF